MSRPATDSGRPPWCRRSPPRRAPSRLRRARSCRGPGRRRSPPGSERACGGGLVRSSEVVADDLDRGLAVERREVRVVQLGRLDRRAPRDVNVTFWKTPVPVLSVPRTHVLRGKVFVSSGGSSPSGIGLTSSLKSPAWGRWRSRLVLQAGEELRGQPHPQQEEDHRDENPAQWIGPLGLLCHVATFKHRSRRKRKPKRRKRFSRPERARALPAELQRNGIRERSDQENERKILSGRPPESARPARPFSPRESVTAGWPITF